MKMMTFTILAGGILLAATPLAKNDFLVKNEQKAGSHTVLLAQNGNLKSSMYNFYDSDDSGYGSSSDSDDSGYESD